MLSSLDLTNFKSFRKATIPLGPFTLLVGTNASGKSNIRDAFRFLHGVGRGYSLAEILGEKYGEGGELQWKGIRGGTREAAFGSEKELTIQADAPQVGVPSDRTGMLYSYRIAVALNGGLVPPHVVRESLYIKNSALVDPMVFDSHPPDEPPAPHDSEHITVRLPPRRPDERREVTLDSDVPVLVQALGLDDKMSRDRRDELKGIFDPHYLLENPILQFRSMRFLGLSPEAMRVPSLPGRHVLGDQGENLSSVLLSIAQDAAKKAVFLEWIRALTPLDVIDLDFPQDFAGRILVHFVEQNGRKISAHSASDGTLRFLALLAALLGPESARFYFIEELENGIHPTRLHLLLRLIEERCREGRVQVIATTHSPWLLGLLGTESQKDALLVYRLEGTPESRLRPLLDLPDVTRILHTQDLARLHVSGWLEDAAELLADQEEEAAQ